MYSASHLANFFLDKAEDEGIGVSPMKLLKLVYIGYGWMYAVLGREPFDEPIEAWRHGPVIPSLYHEFKQVRGGDIVGRSGQFDLDEQKFVEPRIPMEDEDAHVVLGKVWDVYKYFDAWALRNKTHEKDSPWTKSFELEQNNQIQNNQISPSAIQSHFNKKIREYLNVR